MALKSSIISYNALAEAADKFLGQHHNWSLPIPIETIIEQKCGIDIICEAALSEITGVEALVNHTCTAIHIDANVYLSSNTNRYRSSLAHELAHVILHQKVIERNPFKTIAEWRELRDSMEEKEKEWFEWQARCLGGLILVPRKTFCPDHKEICKVSGLDGTKDAATVQAMLAKKYGVSPLVIETRCYYDSKDGLL